MEDFNVSNPLAIRTPADRRAYIDSLGLAASRDMPATEVVAADEKESANAVDGSTVAFVTGFPLLQKTDLLNSALLAQLAANYAFDRENATDQWYRKYVEVLENLGWVIFGFGFTKVHNVGASFLMDKVALNVIAALATGNQLAMAIATLDALRKTGNEKALTLFDGAASTGAAGNFQISAATCDADKNTSMTLGGFFFKSTEHRAKFLWWEWKSASVNMFYACQTVTLNDQIYSVVRADVVKKLGDNAKKYIAEIKIG
jgi:hypothetical protein